MNLYEVSYLQNSDLINTENLTQVNESAKELPTLVVANSFDEAYTKLQNYKNTYFSLRSLVLKQTNTLIA